MQRVGRIQRQVRRRLVAAAGPVSFEELVNWAYAGDRRPWRWPIYRALKRWGVMADRIGLSPAGRQLFGNLGYGGPALADQAADEAEELRRRRLAQMQAGGPMAAGRAAAA